MMEVEITRIEVTPSPEPDRELFDGHTGPLDFDDDARFLLVTDVRRLEVERRRGFRFQDKEDED